MKYSNFMEVTFKALSVNEGFARVCVASFCVQLNPSVDEITDIKTAVSEAVTNCVVHAYPTSIKGDVTLRCELENDIVTIFVSDKGVGIKDINKAREPFYTSKPSAERSGMGFTVMESFMDNVQVESNSFGTSVKMSKKIASSNREVAGWLMLGQNETLELIKKAQSGDENAKEILINENSPLIKSVVRWFRNKGVENDDLYQLGCVGFLKAINNFDVSFNCKFSTYVVPMVIGEIKRFMRDDGAVKVSRAIKVLNLKINKFVNEFFLEHKTSPTISEISQHFKIAEQDVVMAMDSAKMPVSLYTPLEDGEEDGLTIIDRFDSQQNDDFIDKFALKDMINKLDERDKKIILMRYFYDKTQSEIAQRLGVSQVQVSRLENKILENLKKKLS